MAGHMDDPQIVTWQVWRDGGDRRLSAVRHGDVERHGDAEQRYSTIYDTPSMNDTSSRWPGPGPPPPTEFTTAARDRRW